MTTRRDFLRQGTALAGAAAGHHMLLRATSAAAPAANSVTKVKIGLVGTAHPHALGKLDTVCKYPELFEVVGVVEADEKRRAVLSRKPQHAAIPLLTEEKLLNIRGLHAVVIETAVKDLAPTALRIAPAGVHIHLEKPCGTSLTEFRSLLEIVARKKKILQPGYMLRGNPAFQFCVHALRDGWLGDIYEINAVMGKVASAGERNDMKQFPGGSMFELSCHLIDAMVYMLGKPQQVHAYLRQTRQELDTLADNTLAVCEYAKCLATIRSPCNDIEAGHRREFILNGDKGAAAILPIEPPKLMLTLSQSRGEFKAGVQEVPLRKMAGRYDDQLLDFAKMIRGEKEDDFGPEHDLAVLETVLRASGMPVD